MEIHFNFIKSDLQRATIYILVMRTHHYNDNIQYVPDAGEVFEPVYSQFQTLFYHIVKDEHTKYDFKANNEIVPSADVAD